MTTSSARETIRGVAVVATAVVAVAIAANWQGVALTLGILLAEHRPALLKDAAWGDPDSARDFRARFHTGTPERELLAWLDGSGFQVDQSRRQATKALRSAPCVEDIRVDWSAESGRLTGARAVVTQVACL